MAMQTPFSPLSFGKSFMKIRSAIPENGCLVFLWRKEKNRKKTKKNKKNICKTYTHPPHRRLRKSNRSNFQPSGQCDDATQIFYELTTSGKCFCLRAMMHKQKKDFNVDLDFSKVNSEIWSRWGTSVPNFMKVRLLLLEKRASEQTNYKSLNTQKNTIKINLQITAYRL